MAINIDIYKYILVAITLLFSSSYSNESYVFSMQNYFAHGQSLIESYLQVSEQGKRIKSLIPDISNSCVQIEVPNPRGGKNLVSMGSAVIVGKGMFLLSSGHNFIGLNPKTPIKVVGPQGTIKKAYLSKMAFNPKKQTDWAVLQLSDGGFHPKHAVELSRSIKAKEVAIVLGYPQSYGKDNAGQVMHTRADPKKRLNPLVLLAKISHKAMGRKTVLDLESGALFLKGASGGPVFNIEGELMGHYTSKIEVIHRGKIINKASMRPFPKALVRMLNPQAVASQYNKNPKQNALAR